MLLCPPIRESTFYANPEQAMEPVWLMAKDIGIAREPTLTLKAQG